MRQLPQRRLFLQMASFALVGVLNTGLDLGIFWVLTRLAEVPPLPANAAGFLIGSVNSYLMNGLLTFRGHGRRMADRTRITRFALVTACCLVVSSLCLVVALPLMPDLVAKVLATVGTFATGFVLSRLFVFDAGRGDQAAVAKPATHPG